MAANLQPWDPSALATPYMGGARMGGTRRRRVEPTDEWEQLKLLCRWPEQLAYEEIRPTVLFRARPGRRDGFLRAHALPQGRPLRPGRDRQPLRARRAVTGLPRGVQRVCPV